MKIIRLSTFLDFGGIETKMANLSTVQDKNEWIFCAIGKGGDAESKILKNNKRSVCLNLNLKIPSLKTIWKLYQFLKKEKPDILHTSGAEANFFGFISGRLSKVPRIIVEEIGIGQASKKADFIFDYIFKNADFVVGESAIVVATLKNKYNLKNHNIGVIHNFGVFCLQNFSRTKNTSAFHLVMISRLESVKNIEGVINVVVKLLKKGYKIKLTIAGDGSLEDQLKNKVRELNVTENILFTGYIDDPYPYLFAADLYILNSFTEGFSNSLLEAMYSKTPCLSTNVGSASEMIQENVNGFLVPPDDEDALEIQLENIIKLSGAEMSTIGNAGHTMVVNKFTLEKHVKNLIKIYKR